MISTRKHRDYLGLGIYTPREAARYAHVHTQLMTRWLFGAKGGPAVVHHKSTTARIASSLFWTLFSAAIRAIRNQYKGLSLQKIRQAVDRARKDHGIDYPFATKHRTFVFVREEPDAKRKPDEEEPTCEIIFDNVQLTGRNAGNLIMREIAEVYMSDISYDSHGLAMEYVALQRGGLRVVMNPKKRFGEPLVPSGYTAETLWEAAKSEGSVEAAAKAYGVDRTEVELACCYFDFLQGTSAP